MRKPVFVKATEAHALELAKTIRGADRDELTATSGGHPLEALYLGIRDSDESWAVLVDGCVMCMWGVRSESASYGSAAACGWLVASIGVELYRKEFWRACLAVLPALLREYGCLYNYIDCRHEKALRWARRLGFWLEDPILYGVEARPFRRFTVNQEDLQCATRRLSQRLV